jgi:hypothetical protein
MTHLNPDLRITHYRWGSDGTETGHGWLADEDTAYELPNGDLDSTFFLRVCVQENNGDNTNANTYQLQRNIDGAGAGDVTGASTGIRASASGNIADDAATSNRIGGTGTFVAGRFDEADGNTTTGITLSQTEHTELLYSITARSADLSGGEAIVFTLVSVEDIIDAHDVTITLNIGSPAADTTDEEFAATQAIGRNPPAPVRSLGSEAQLAFEIDAVALLPVIYADSWHPGIDRPDRQAFNEMVGYGDGQPRRVPADAIVVAGDPTLTMHLDFALNDGSTINAAIISGPSSLTFTRASDGTNFDESGVLPTNTTNAPRYDHDPGAADAPLGILLEGAATNECLRSEDFSTTWTVNGTPVITTNDAVSPSGATDADKIDDDNSGVVESVKQDITVANNSTSWCYSVFVKKTSSDTHYAALDFRLINGSTTILNGGVVLNTNTGVISATEADVDNSGVIDAGDYWRFWGVMTNNSSGNTTARVFLVPAWNTDGTATASASATGFKHFWGAQLENTAYPTSYIATTTTSVTRAKDDLSTTSIAWANADYTGSYVIEFSTTEVAASTSNENGLFSLRDWTSDDNIFLDHRTAGLRSQMQGETGTFNIAGGTALTANTSYKAGLAVASTNDGEMYLNGSSDGTDISYGPPPVNAPSAFEIGSKAELVNARHGWVHIKNIRYWNERKDDTFMIAETT